VPLSVTLVQLPGSPVQLRIYLPAGNEPVLAWSGTSGPGPYRLALIWSDVPLSLAVPLPALPSNGTGPLQAIDLRTVGTTNRLEVLVRERVYPKLRRVGGVWVLELEPEVLLAPIAQQSPAASRHPAAPAVPIAASAGQPLQIAPATGVGGPGAASLSPRAGNDPDVLTRREPAIPGSQPPQPEQLLVDFTVNGLRQPEIAHAERGLDGRVLVASDDWRAARLKPPGQPLSMADGTPGFALDAVAGLRYTVNQQRMSIDVVAPPPAFAASTMDTQQAQEAVPPKPTPGALLNYDLTFMRRAGAPATSAATVEAVGFGPLGTVRTSALANDDGQRRHLERLDSYWQYDMPQSMQTLVLGDTVGVGGGWSQPVRYGGLRWGRDFGLRPGFVTMPLQSLTGEAALPSTIDLLVNDSRRFSQSASPGPFDITNVPVITGAGELSLVVRDILGRQTVIRQSYYASPRLLAPGLSDFSLDAGWLRTGYGRDSQYGDAFGAATARLGITSRLSVEGRVELQRERQASGFEAAGLIGTWGVWRLGTAASRDHVRGAPEQGALSEVGIERSTPLGGGALQYTRATRGFAPFGESSAPEAPADRSREQVLVSMGGRLWGAVNGGVTYARRVQWSGERASTVGLSMNIPVGQMAVLTLAAARRDETRAWFGSVNLNVPLGTDQYLGSRLERREDGHMTASVLAVRNPPPGPGLGWHAETSSEPQQRARGSVQYNTDYSELTAEMVADADTQVSSHAGAHGTVGIMAGLPFASRPIGQSSFAVVQVDGLPDVPIKRSNQIVARTDARGLAFVPGLIPWHKNAIEIDAADLPLDVETRGVRQEVIPYAQSGTMVKFDVRRTRQALLVLRQRDGQPVPVGARVQLLPGGAEFDAGRRGEVWLTDLVDRMRATVRWPGGGCDLDLHVPPSENGAPASLGPLVCDGGPR
jgi:outer membrane usher protein